MHEIKDITEAGSSDITKSDLRAALETEGRGVECAIVILRKSGAPEESQEPEAAQVIYWPKSRRGAVAWGGDAVWTDGTSLRDVAERVLVTGEVIE